MDSEVKNKRFGTIGKSLSLQDRIIHSETLNNNSKDSEIERTWNHYSGHVEEVNLANHFFDEQHKSFDGRVYGKNFKSRDPVAGNTQEATKNKKNSTQKSPFRTNQNKNKQNLSIEGVCTKTEKIIRSNETEKTLCRLENHNDLHRSWLEPEGCRLAVERCYLPKKLVHTWSGHHGGVQKILWFPKTAHLLLSGGLDGKIKIWDVYNDHRCVHTYSGHDNSIRDITYTNYGREFVSSGFDNRIKIWDTETGKLKQTIAFNKLGYVIKIHPDDDKQHVLLVGCSDRKIYQYDLKTGDVVQEYDRHLDAVNTITFINKNRWFLTTSDDKTIRVWEFGIPEQIKYIACPSMYSIPYVSSEPKNKRLLMQSMDNTILTYEATDRVHINRKKIFKGHKNVGYACQVGMSPDGRYVLSGDGQGKCYFWDWATTRIVKTIEAHRGACLAAMWHPYETSKVVTSGWGDALIRCWD